MAQVTRAILFAKATATTSRGFRSRSDTIQGSTSTDTASIAITVTRLFGLDAGDWSMILLGLALSALLLVLA
jgi:hypothetical protein